jgi:predicted cupin superfamily sugar epimerase
LAGAVWRDQAVPSAEDRMVPALPTATKRPAPQATSFSCVVVPGFDFADFHLAQ